MKKKTYGPLGGPIRSFKSKWCENYFSPIRIDHSSKKVERKLTQLNVFSMT